MSNLKIWTTTFYLIFSFLCILCSSNGKAQNYFKEADSLFEAGAYFPAAVAYEKVVYVNDDKDIESLALLRKAYAYKALGEFAKAHKTLQRINVFDLNNADQFKIRYEIALNAYLAENYTEAESEIIQLEYYIEDKQLKQEVIFLKILILNELQKWKESKSIFTQYVADNNLDLNPEEIFYFAENPKLRSPEKASVLSTFLPGAGQIYGGSIISGLGSFTIQAAFLAFGIYNFWHGYYITGLFSGLAFLQAFYFGGIQHAAYITNKKNEEKIRKYNESVKTVILNIEKGKLK